MVACEEPDALILFAREITGGGQTNEAYIRIGAGNVERATVSACQIIPELRPKVRVGIQLLPGTRQCLITGNIFGLGDYIRFIINLTTTANVLINQNVGAGLVWPR